MTVDEVQELVEEIQLLVGASNDPLEEELIDLAARHDEVVGSVVLRLREVEQLLSKGLRPEAIEVSEREPNLNELVVALDFPELEVWNDLLTQWEIQAIRELPLDVAAELNDAYSVSVPLQKLLAGYRRQSLARVPLNERIATLRKLCTADPGDTRWRKDLVKFETHRLGVVQKELQLAVNHANLSQVAKLDQELSGEAWTIKIPVSLQKSARKSHIQIRQNSAREELNALCPQLSDAFADFDKSTATSLRERYRALAEILDLDQSDPCYEIAGPALEWLQDEDNQAVKNSEFEERVVELEAALDQPTPLDELERLYDRAVRHGHSLPELLEQRLASRTEGMRSSERRKRYTVLGAIAGLCLLCLVGVVLTVQHFAFGNAVEEYSRQAADLLKGAVSSGDFQAVDAYFATIQAEDSRYLLQPQLAGLKEKVELARTEETGRKSQLDGFLTEALAVATGQPRWEQLDQVEQSLQKADAITLNSVEKARVLDAVSKVREKRSVLQQQADDAFRTELDGIVARMDELPKDSVRGYPLVKQQIVELQNSEHVSSELMTTLKTLKTKVEHQQELVQADLDVARDLLKIRQAVGRINVYRRALQDYTTAHPGTTRSDDFQSLLQTDPKLWDGVVTWNKLRRRFADSPLSDIARDDAAMLKKEFDEFQQASGPYPGDTLEAEYLNALGYIAARSTSQNGTSIQQIDRMFAPRTISDAYLIQTKDDLRYFTDKPKLSQTFVEFNFFLTPTGTQLEAKKLRNRDIQGLRERRSPQFLMTQRIQSELKERLETDFEEAITWGVEAIFEEHTVDAILRLFLIEKLLQIGAEGSLFVSRKMEPHLESIANTEVSRLTNWVSPEQSLLKRERLRAKLSLERQSDKILKDLKAVIPDRNDQTADSQVGPAMKCVGFLHRNVKGQWVVTLRYQLTVSAGTDLYALGHTDTGPRFDVVASLSKTAVGTIPASADEFAREGQLIYSAAGNTIGSGGSTVSNQ
ncbi:MAG: hypothetical protein MK102_17770 [Fuerstiella sp.]|nr:hypothetical protein [Fuerstiella sp.]